MRKITLIGRRAADSIVLQAPKAIRNVFPPYFTLSIEQAKLSERVPFRNAHGNTGKIRFGGPKP